MIVLWGSACRKDNGQEERNRVMTAEIDRICDSVLQHSALPGMAVGIWSQANRFSYVKAKGIANIQTREAFDVGQSFRVGSNTKALVVTVLLQLADEGKLSLDDLLVDYLPSFPHADRVTLRMLCDMTSGYPNYTETEAFGAILETNSLKKWEPAELIALVEGDDLLFEPGTELYYSNTNTVLLGMIIEDVEGATLNDVIAQRIVARLGLQRTYLPMDNLLPTGGVRGYMREDDTESLTEVGEKYDVTWAWAAGGMVSNLYELKSVVEALVDGGLVSTQLHNQRFHGKQFPNGITYGVGLFSPLITDMWGHNGGLPGYTSIMMHHRTEPITMVILFNWQDDRATPDALLQRLVQVVHPELK